MLGDNLIINYEEAAAMILFAIGFCMLLFHRNLVKKIMGLNIMDTVVSVSVTALMLALTVRLYKRYRTLNLDEIYQKAREEHK